MSFFKKINLKKKLMMISVGMTFIFGATMVIFFENGLSKQKESVTLGLTQYSDLLSSSIAQVFYAQYHNVQAFAKNEGLKNLEKPENIQFILNELISLYPLNDMFILTDMSGKLIASNSINAQGKKLNIKSLKDINFSNILWFKDTKDGNLTENYKEKIFGSRMGVPHIDKIISKVYGQDRFGTHFTTLIESEYGDPLAVLTGYTNFAWVEEEMKNLYQALSSAGKDKTSILLLNKSGIVISHFGLDKQNNERSIIHNFEKTNLKLNLFKKYPLIASNLKNKKVIKNKVNSKKNNKKNQVKSLEKSLVLTDFFNPKEKTLYVMKQMIHKRFLKKIGWSIIIGINPADAFSDIMKLRVNFYSAFFILFTLLSIISYMVVIRLNKTLSSIVDEMKFSSEKNFKAIKEMMGISSKVVSITGNQASAIQKTASTLDEITQMVAKTTTNAQDSEKVASESEESTADGRDIVGNMISSVNDIKSNNESILMETAESNIRLNNIVDLITKISEKTQVINDIVFQTKLLSFNASVEAARAGEHGKGFAVVAEEIGNLAVQSGQSADEIRILLDDSVKSVKGIVEESQKKIDTLMNDSKASIENGIAVTNQCYEAFGVITGGVKNLSTMAKEISKAANEQGIGVSQISEAMNLIQQASHESTIIAEDTRQSSEILNDEYNFLLGVIQKLESEVAGKKQ